MIYGQQPVCQPASQLVDQPTNQSAGWAASRTSTACTIPCASAINAGIILIRSILGSGLASLRFRFYPRTQLLSLRESEMERSSPKKKEESR